MPRGITQRHCPANDEDRSDETRPVREPSQVIVVSSPAVSVLAVLGKKGKVHLPR